nr:metal-sensitive transcriptional regulator [Nocardioides acrostichi]
MPPSEPEPSPASGTDLTSFLNRVRRAQGQLGGILRMVEEKRDLDEIIHQLKAVSRALDRAGFTLVAGDVRQRAAAGEQVTEADLAQLEKRFLTLR